MGTCNCNQSAAPYYKAVPAGAGESTSAANETCSAIGYQKVDVCVPVTVAPFARVQNTKTYCCGDPIVSSVATCTGTQNGTCTFTIAQTVCVEIPVKFGAKATVADAFVQCGGASTSCCDEPAPEEPQ